MIDPLVLKDSFLRGNMVASFLTGGKTPLEQIRWQLDSHNTSLGSMGRE